VRSNNSAFARGSAGSSREALHQQIGQLLALGLGHAIEVALDRLLATTTEVF
jgi:hypothetical protein